MSFSNKTDSSFMTFSSVIHLDRIVLSRRLAGSGQPLLIPCASQDFAWRRALRLARLESENTGCGSLGIFLGAGGEKVAGIKKCLVGVAEASSFRCDV